MTTTGRGDQGPTGMVSRLSRWLAGREVMLAPILLAVVALLAIVVGLAFCPGAR